MGCRMTRKQAAALAEIESCRIECHQLVDSKYDALIRRLLEEEYESRLGQGERMLTLAALPEVFKGKKPVSLILPGGTEVKVSTWKKAVAAILQDCNRDPQRHQWMLELRDRMFGNFRPLLAKTAEGMDAPLKIDEGLYWESKFDTEALLKNLTDKLLSKVGYDYQGVVVRYRDPQQDDIVAGTPTRDEQDCGTAYGMSITM